MQLAKDNLLTLHSIRARGRERDTILCRDAASTKFNLRNFRVSPQEHCACAQELGAGRNFGAAARQNYDLSSNFERPVQTMYGDRSIVRE